MKKIMLGLGGAGLALLLLFLLIPAAFILMMIVLISDDGFGDFNAETENLTSHVLQYEDTIRNYAEKNDIGNYTPVIMAIMQQESGGNPSESDPMQSSESLCGYIGCITNPEHSIQQGVKHFKSVLDDARGDLKLAIQSYNFGNGFIDYVLKRNGEYEFNKDLEGKATYNLALKFSQEQYQTQQAIGNGSQFTCLRKEAKPYDACYGDVLYVWSVMQYLNVSEDGEIVEGGGIVEDVDTSGKFAKPVNAEVISGFGPRPSPGNGGSTDHNGIDLGVPSGTGVGSSASGVVTQTESGCSVGNYSCGKGWGNHVIIRHEIDGETFDTVYGHLTSPTTKIGDKVSKGEVIGKSGNTGASTGPHLHFEVHPGGFGNPVDPRKIVGT